MARRGRVTSLVVVKSRFNKERLLIAPPCVARRPFAKTKHNGIEMTELLVALGLAACLRDGSGGFIGAIHDASLGQDFPELRVFGSIGLEIHGLSVGPGFPELREQLEIMRPGTVRHSVRQYLVQGLELFAVHRRPVAREIHGAQALRPQRRPERAGLPASGAHPPVRPARGGRRTRPPYRA